MAIPRWPTPRRRSSGSTSRGPPAAGPRSGPARLRAPTWSWSAAGTPGCGPPCWPRSATRRATSSLLEAGSDRLGGVRPQRRVLRGQPDPRRGQRAGPLAGGVRHAAPARPGEPRRHRARPSQRYGIDCDFRRTGELTVATAPHQVEWLREELRRRAASSTGTRCAPSWTRRPTWPGCSTPTRRRWSTRPAWPGAWRDAAESLGVRIAERTPGDGPRRATAPGIERRHRRRARGPGPARWPWAPTPSRRCCGARGLHTVPVYDYVLMTEPLSAAQRRLDRLGAAGRRRRHGQPVPLLPADRRTTGSSGAATTRSTTSAADVETASTSGPRRSTGWPGTSSRPSPSSRGCGSATAGAGRSTPAPGSARSSAPPTAAASPTPLGYTGLGVGATRFGAQVMLDLLDGRAHRARPSWRWCASKPLPFPPEPLAYAGIQLTRWSLARADERRGPAQPVAARPRPARPRLRLLAEAGQRALDEEGDAARPGRTPRPPTSPPDSGRARPRGSRPGASR